MDGADMPQKVNHTKLEKSLTSFIIDDFTMQILTYIIYTASCQCISIFGIITNIINIICFIKQGFKDTITVSLIGLSVSDLASLEMMVITCIFVTPAFVAADLPFESIDVGYLVSGLPRLAFTRVSSCITAVIILERCLSIVAPLKINRIFTPKRAGVINIGIFFIFTFSATPSYVVNSLGLKFSYLKNKSVVGIISTRGRDEVEMITLAINNLFIPFCAFLIVAIGTIILSIQLHKQAKWRKTTTSDGKADRISSRNKKVAKMVVSISAVYVACSIPTSCIMLAIGLERELWVKGKYMNLAIILWGVAVILECINSSVNICIYHHMSKNYRHAFQSIVTRGRPV